MNTPKDFVKFVFATLHEKLLLLGFVKRKQELFTIPETLDSMGWLGLNRAVRTREGMLEVNPVVGVRNQQLERLVAKLTAEPFNEFAPPSLSGNIGYMGPNQAYKAFVFSQNSSVELLARDLVDALTTDGLPFIKNHADLNTLLEALGSARFAMPEPAAYRIPTALHLLGRRQESEEFLKRKIIEIGERTDPAAVRFKAFESRIRQLNLGLIE